MTEIVVQGGVFYYARIEYWKFNELLKVCQDNEFIEVISENGCKCKILKSAIVGYGEYEEEVNK